MKLCFRRLINKSTKNRSWKGRFPAALYDKLGESTFSSKSKRIKNGRKEEEKMKNHKSILMAVLILLLIAMSSTINVKKTLTTDGASRAVQWQNPCDRNGNKVDDLIDYSTEQIFDIFVDYTVHPNQTHIDKLNETILQAGGNISSVYWYIYTIAVVNVNQTTIDIIKTLPEVKMVWLQLPIESFLDTSSRAIQARYSSKYSGEYVWAGKGDLGDNITQGENVTIAILDSGVDDEHEALQGKFLGGFDATKFEDLNGDGKDDVSANGYEPADGTTNPDDQDPISPFHGTHCASIALGNPPDGRYVGVAPKARLVDIKVSTPTGLSTNHDFIEGIEWATKMKLQNKNWNVTGAAGYEGIDVLSISQGSRIGYAGQDPTSRAVNNAVNAGIVVVVAAGNNGPNNTILGSPASADLAITVAAIDDNGTVDRSDDTIWTKSSRGPRTNDGDSDPYDELKPEVAAPGVNITGAKGSNTPGGASNEYHELNGTSMATPHVAGAVALILSHYESIGISLTPKQVEDILCSSAEDKDGTYDPNLSSKYDVNYGWGIVSAYWALYVHDVAITSVTPDKTSVDYGGSVSINVTLQNQGDFPGKSRTEVSENCSVSVFYSGNLIGTRSGVSLAPEATTTLTFAWTASVPAGSYGISAIASTVPLEFDTADNTLSDGTITVKSPPSPPVGGIEIPIDNLALLAPYIGLTSAILIATVATAAYVQHVRRRKEKQ
jgi:subtilisin family serine protease